MENTSIGVKIKKIRELKNFTQEYMADKLGVGQSSYSRFEKDGNDLTFNQINKIADILEIGLDDLLNFNDQFIFNNYKSNKANQGYIVNNFSENERKLYEDKIKLLEEKISWLESKNK